MKASFLTLLAALALTFGTATAQTAPPEGGMQGRGRMHGSPDEMAKHQAERMTNELGLNPDQTTKVQQILAARGQEMQAMRGQGGGDREQMRDQMQANRAKYDAKFKEVLTADQYNKYLSMEDKRMSHGGPGKGDGKMKVKTTAGDKLKVTDDKVKVK